MFGTKIREFDESLSRCNNQEIRQIIAEVFRDKAPQYSSNLEHINGSRRIKVQDYNGSSTGHGNNIEYHLRPWRILLCCSDTKLLSILDRIHNLLCLSIDLNNPLVTDQ